MCLKGKSMKKHPLTPTQRGIRDCLRNGWKLWDVGSSIYLGDPERDIFQHVRRQTLRALLSKGIVTWYEKCNGRNYYILAEEA